MKPKNVIAWFDVPTLDFDRAVKFYSDILGEEVKKQEFMGQTLAMFPMEGTMEDMGVGGDIVPPNEDYKPSKNGTRVYLSVEGMLDEVLGRVEKAGGKIVQPKTNIGDPGFIAMIEDTEGNVVGLHSMK
jgi:predicted enzyme related to lactoylglutathione lyase